MRKACILTCLIIFALASSLQGQVYKAFLDKKGIPVDSAHADSYILYKQLEDSLWVMQQLDLGDTLLFAATYKDPQLRIQHGEVYRFWKGKNPSGKEGNNYYLQTTGHFIDGKKSGTWTEYFSNGKPKSITSFENNVEHGAHEIYTFEGIQPSVVGNFVNGKAEGEWLEYNMDGELYRTTWYKNGKQKNVKRHKGILTDIEKGNSVNNITQAMPPGGMASFVNTLSRSLYYPPGINNTNLNTTLLLKFTVKEDGSLSDFAVIKSIDPTFDDKVIQYLKQSPKWKPALSHGKPINQNFTLPIRLYLFEDEFKDHRFMRPIQ